VEKGFFIGWRTEFASFPLNTTKRKIAGTLSGNSRNFYQSPFPKWICRKPQAQPKKPPLFLTQ
jgi:hypothetical protein